MISLYTKYCEVSQDGARKINLALVPIIQPGVFLDPFLKFRTQSQPVFPMRPGVRPRHTKQRIILKVIMYIIYPIIYIITFRIICKGILPAAC